MTSVTLESTGTKHKKILVVDDLKVMADLWKTKFMQMGFDVDMTSDGEEALHALQSKHFDAVLLDLSLPKKNGFEVLEEKVKTQNSATPTFVITGSIKPEDVTRAKKLGAKAAFMKYQTSPKEVISALTSTI